MADDESSSLRDNIDTTENAVNNDEQETQSTQSYESNFVINSQQTEDDYSNNEIKLNASNSYYDDTQFYDDEVFYNCQNDQNNNDVFTQDLEEKPIEEREKYIETQSKLFHRILETVGSNLNLSVSSKLENLINENKLELNEMSANKNLLQLLNQLDNNCLEAFDEYSKRNECNSDILLQTINNWLKLTNNKMAINEQYKNAQNNHLEENNYCESKSVLLRPGPNEQKLKEILERTKYSHEVSTGQRKYGGPPPDWRQSTEQNESISVNQAPPGSECFVGKIPKEIFEDELIPLFEKHGRIWDLRLMIDPNTGFSKGYCFVTYCDKMSAKEAAAALNNFEIRPGKNIVVNLSVANLKLFIGNIPRHKSVDEIKQVLSKIADGIVRINFGMTNKESINRGFCFIEFVDHKSASLAKRKLISPKFNNIFNREIVVEWADTQQDPDEETMSKVKILYVTNLSSEITENDIEQLFGQYGKLERVKRLNDYAFVHFVEREDALKAMKEQSSKVFGNNKIEISLAIPKTDKKKAQHMRFENKHNISNNSNFSFNSNASFNMQRMNNLNKSRVFHNSSFTRNISNPCASMNPSMSNQVFNINNTNNNNIHGADFNNYNNNRFNDNFQNSNQNVNSNFNQNPNRFNVVKNSNSHNIYNHSHLNRQMQFSSNSPMVGPKFNQFNRVPNNFQNNHSMQSFDNMNDEMTLANYNNINSIGKRKLQNNFDNEITSFKRMRHVNYSLNNRNFSSDMSNDNTQQQANTEMYQKNNTNWRINQNDYNHSKRNINNSVNSYVHNQQFSNEMPNEWYKDNFANSNQWI
jgi:Q family heterogeneous nuclear ribonucleoprotein R